MPSFSPQNTPLVGFQALPHVEAALAIVRKKEAGRWKILVTRRKNSAILGGLWEFPGGKMDAGETPQQAVRRELVEELNLPVEAEAPWPAVEFSYPHARVRLWPCYCRALGEQIENKEVQEHRWVEIHELADLEFPPANVPILDRLIRELNEAPDLS